MKDDGEISAATDGVKYAGVVPEPTAQTSTAETESYTECLILLISVAEYFVFTERIEKKLFKHTLVVHNAKQVTCFINVSV